MTSEVAIARVYLRAAAKAERAFKRGEGYQEVAERLAREFIIVDPFADADS